LRSFRSRRLFNLEKIFSKYAACSCHAGSFVKEASEEFFGSGIPARKRATSSGIGAPDCTGWRAGAAEARTGAGAMAGFGVALCHGHCIAKPLKSRAKNNTVAQMIFATRRSLIVGH
jgi:hypothetical protein